MTFLIFTFLPIVFLCEVLNVSIPGNYDELPIIFNIKTGSGSKITVSKALYRKICRNKHRES